MSNNKKVSGLVYISKNASDNEKAPLMKGFINITPELLEVLNSLEPDSYGSVKLEVALWKDQEKQGVLKGSATPPFKKESDYSKAKKQPVRKTEEVETDF